MARLYLIGVKLTKEQRDALDREVRRRKSIDVHASRSSVMRLALQEFVAKEKQP